MRRLKPALTSRALGVSIAHDSVRAVAVRAGQVIWSSEAARTDESMAALAIALRECLASAPRQRFGRTPVNVAIGPHAAQMRHLTELPPLDDVRSLARVVEEGASRFFLRNGASLVTTGVRIVAPGEAWAAAFERPLAEAIIAVCEEERLLLRGIVPSVAVLGVALSDAFPVWRDGPVVAHLMFQGGRLLTLRRVLATPLDGTDLGGDIPPGVTAPLAVLGEDAWRYADACGAAIMPRDSAVVLRPGRIASSGRRVPRWRLAFAMAFCAASVSAALSAPGFTASRSAERAAERLAQMAPTRRNIAITALELEKATTALNELAAFSARRRSRMLLLESLTDAIPREAFIVALRADSAGGNLMLLAPRAATVLSGLDSIMTIAGPEIVGPVTRDAIGARELERLTVRFQWSRVAASPEWER